MTTRSDDTLRDVLTSLDEAIARAASKTIELPHVVYIFDREAGTPCALGPFGSAIEACAYAERVVREIVGDAGDTSSLRTDVVPLESASSELPTPIAGLSWRHALRRWLRPGQDQESRG